MPLATVAGKEVFRPELWGCGTPAADAKLASMSEKLIKKFNKTDKLGERLTAYMQFMSDYHEYASGEEGKAAQAHANVVEKNIIDFAAGFCSLLPYIDIKGVNEVCKKK